MYCDEMSGFFAPLPFRPWLFAPWLIRRRCIINRVKYFFCPKLQYLRLKFPFCGKDDIETESQNLQTCQLENCS